jgi:hypothetical protein|tara:strand:+ start:209 stop:424 length:216 start_codon:yes stop_codon:yes gene_type:complete
MTVVKWNEIQDVFVDAFGWQRGVELMLGSISSIKKGKHVYELNLQEENQITKVLRKTYNKEKQWLEKEKVK